MRDVSVHKYRHLKRSLFASAGTLTLGILLSGGLTLDEANAVVCFNTNPGQDSGSDGGVATNTACGNFADASGTFSFNTAIGSGSTATSGAPSSNVAIGHNAT